MTEETNKGGRPKRLAGETVVVSSHLFVEQAAALDALAARHGTSRSEQVRRAVAEYVDHDRQDG